VQTGQPILGVVRVALRPGHLHRRVPAVGIRWAVSGRGLRASGALPLSSSQSASDPHVVEVVGVKSRRTQSRSFLLRTSSTGDFVARKTNYCYFQLLIVSMH